MTTAFNLNMAMALQGPTQCGKFETVNALAKLLGRLVIVFCCNQTTQITAFTTALQGWFIFHTACHLYFQINFSCGQNGSIWNFQGLFEFAGEHFARNIVQSRKVFEFKSAKPYKYDVS